MKELTKEKRQEFLDTLENNDWAIRILEDCPHEYGLKDSLTCEDISERGYSCYLCWMKALKESLDIRYETY